MSYWNTGQVGMYDPSSKTWREWKLPGSAHAYSVWVDDHDKVWLTDWSTNAIVRFDPITREIRQLSVEPRASECAPDARPFGRSVGRRVGRRPAGDGAGTSALGSGSDFRRYLRRPYRCGRSARSRNAIGRTWSAWLSSTCGPQKGRGFESLIEGKRWLTYPLKHFRCLAPHHLVQRRTAPARDREPRGHSRAASLGRRRRSGSKILDCIRSLHGRARGACDAPRLRLGAVRQGVVGVPAQPEGVAPSAPRRPASVARGAPRTACAA